MIAGCHSDLFNNVSTFYCDNMHKMISSKILEGMKKFIYTSNNEHRELYSNMGMRMQHIIFLMMRCSLSRW
jgi:hypothetical protein